MSGHAIGTNFRVATPAITYPIPYTISFREQNRFGVYKSRLDFLQNEAVEDGFKMCHQSFASFWSFVFSFPRLRTCNLGMSDDGEIHAVWKDGQRASLALYFLGDNTIQYAILKQSNENENVSSYHGTDSPGAILERIDDLDLRTLVFT